MGIMVAPAFSRVVIMVAMASLTGDVSELGVRLKKPSIRPSRTPVRLPSYSPMV